MTNTKVRIDIDGEIHIEELRVLTNVIEGMKGFDFDLHVRRVIIKNPESFEFLDKHHVREIKGEYDDNSYFPSEKESEHLANQLKQIDKHRQTSE